MNNLFVFTFIILFFNANINAQNLKLEDLEISILKVPALEYDTIVMRLKIINVEKADFIYLTFGYKDSSNCQVFFLSYKFIIDSQGIYFQPTQKGTINAKISEDGDFEARFLVDNFKYCEINYGRANASDTDGVYTEMIYYRNSYKLADLPCKK